MLDKVMNSAFEANKKQRLSLASNSSPNAAGGGPSSTTATVTTAMVVADPSTSNASAADRIHPYQLPEMPADMIGGTALNGILPSIFEASIPEVVVKLFHFWGFDSELKQIEEMLIKINLVHDDGERKMYINKLIEKWVGSVKETAYEIDDVVDKMNVDVLRLQVENEFELRKRGWFKRKMLSELKEIVKKLDELVRKASDYGLKSRKEYETLPPYWTCRFQTSHSVDITEIYGRTEDIDRVISYLFHRNVSDKRKYSVIGILGMGGIGKTTLAQLVFRDERVEEEFELRSWVCVSDVFDVKSVLKDLCGKFPTKNMNDNMSLDECHSDIENLVRGKKILFVLDDMWTDRDEDWENLKAPFCQCAEGSVILVTTRNRSVLETMRSREIHKLERLEEDHCWDLFRERAFSRGNMNAELEEMGRKLVQKCKGVPLAAKVLSSILCGVDDKRKWNYILESMFWDLPVESDGIFPALRISYHCLPHHLKLCFLHLSLFPTDYNLKKDEVVQLWIGEGLVDSNHGRELEVVGSEYYDTLQERSLIEADHKLHDLVHSMAHKLSKKFYWSRDDLSASSNVDARARHFWGFSLEGNAPERFSKVVSLRTFIKPVYVGSCIGGISGWNYLRVLELDVTWLSETSYSMVGNINGHLRRLKITGDMETLPNSICRLHSLQALELAGTGVKNLPEEIGNLISLRLLRLEETEISQLPISICNLLHLRTIDLSDCNELTEIPYQIGKLQNLRNLYLQYTHVRHLPDSICNITGLEILDLSRCSELQSLPPGLSNLVNLLSLGMDYLSEEVRLSLPPNIGRLVRLRDTLWFRVGKEAGRGMRELQHLDNITGLHLCNMENIENVEEAEMAALMNKKFIKSLSFRWRSPDRDFGDEGGELEWKVVEALQPHPSNIEYLAFEGYGGKILPSWMHTLHFSCLKELRMSNMNRLTTVTALTLNSLEILVISECPDLREVVIVAPNLWLLTVESCPEMICLSIQACSEANNSEDASDLMHQPLVHQLGALPHTVECLHIRNCEKLGPLYQSM